MLEGVRNDYRNVLGLINYREPERGLHTYSVNRPDGSRMRIHLRVEPTGAGVLFIDVTDVIHLNQIATEIVKMALDGISSKTAKVKELKELANVPPNHPLYDKKVTYSARTRPYPRKMSIME